MPPPSQPPPEEWDFSNVSDEELEICFLHEYARERPGGPKVPLLFKYFEEELSTPFLRLSPDIRRKLKNYFLPPLRPFFIGCIRDIFPLLRASLDKAEQRKLGEMIIEKANWPEDCNIIPLQFTGDLKVLARTLQPSIGRTGDLLLLLRVDTEKASSTDLAKHFQQLLTSLPIKASGHLRGKTRGPKPFRQRKVLANLAIMRIRHHLPFTEAIKIYQSSYLEKEFCDRDGDDFFHCKEDVMKRLDERRSSAIRTFQKLNPDLGEEEMPRSAHFFSGI